MQLRILLLTLIFFSIWASAFCQDYISINNEEKFKVRVLEIGSYYMIYQLWDDDGVVYRVNRAHITDIDFDDSMDVVFNDSYPVLGGSKRIMKSRKSGNYLVGEEWVGSFWSLEPHINKHTKASTFFFKAQKQRSRARFLGVSTIVLIGGGIALANSLDYYDLAFAIAAGSAIIVGPALGTIAIGLKIASINNKRKTEKVYGIQYVNQSIHQPYQDVASLNVGLSQNGLGLFVHF